MDNYKEVLCFACYKVCLQNDVWKSVMPDYKDAIKAPKGGAVSMSPANIQAVMALTIAEANALRPQAVYNWANENVIKLVDYGAQFKALNINPKTRTVITLDVLNSTVMSIVGSWDEYALRERVADYPLYGGQKRYWAIDIMKLTAIGCYPPADDVYEAAVKLYHEIGAIFPKKLMRKYPKLRKYHLKGRK